VHNYIFDYALSIGLAAYSKILIIYLLGLHSMLSVLKFEVGMHNACNFSYPNLKCAKTAALQGPRQLVYSRDCLRHE
jgi:hypothetical protein